MKSKAEIVASQALRAVLAPLATGASIEASQNLREFESALEYFLPEELGWRDEAFDAFKFGIARKVAHDEAEFVGLGLLISDQAWTAIHLWLRLSPDSDEVALLDCRVGEPRDGRSGIVRIPYASRRVSKVLFGWPERIGTIQWVFRAVRD